MMKNSRRANRNKGLLSFHIIKNASAGDVDALHRVLEHYEGYIRRLSTKVIYDEYGQAHYWVDEDLRKRLEIKLLTTTLKFRIERVENR